MDISKVSRFLNFTTIMLTLIAVGLPVVITMTNLNLKNTSPSNFVAVQIEGVPTLKPVIIQNNPVHNSESIKSWVKISANHFLNYTVNNYIDVIKSGRKFMTARYFDSFSINHALRIKENVNNGYLISSSVVVEDPVLVSQANVNGVQYYKYYVVTSTIYKGQTKNAIKKHELIVTVKMEKPEDNLNGIAIDELVIK